MNRDVGPAFVARNRRHNRVETLPGSVDLAYFEWTEDLCVNEPLVDTQHKHLFELAEALFDAMKAGAGRTVLKETLRELLEYTVVHFAAEEQLIAQRQYPGEEAHRREHEALTARVQVIHDKFIAGTATTTIELMQFLREWLQGHIANEDMRSLKI